MRSLEDAAGVEQEETPQTEDAHEISGEPPAKKKKKHTITTSFEEAVKKLTDSAEVQKTPSNEGIFEVVNSLKQELKEEEMGPHVNAALENVVNALIKEALHEEKPQEKLNKYHRPENCE